VVVVKARRVLEWQHTIADEALAPSRLLAAGVQTRAQIVRSDRPKVTAMNVIFASPNHFHGALRALRHEQGVSRIIASRTRIHSN
jgi:hypothetical protein